MKNPFGHRKDYRLSYRLLLYIMICSSFFTITGTCVQLYFDYRRDIEKIHDGIRHIERGYLQSIASNLWEMDRKQIKKNLEGAFNLPDIQYIELRELRDSPNAIIETIGTKTNDSIISKSFFLEFGKDRKRIGTLLVVASKNAVFDRLKEKTLIILATQALKTFFVSIAILLIFYFLIMRHLNSLTKFFIEFGINGLSVPLSINRKSEPSHPDEFGRLVDSVNLMRIGLKQNIEKKVQAEEQIKASLKEKEIILQEIHHRVKNNMAVIASLLKLQEDDVEDNQIKEILKESQSRVYAMSAVHEMLHGSENLAEIDLKTYLSKITSSIFQTYSANPGKVKLNTDIEKIPININQASPLGLIINELISNSLKYAFPDDRKGEINVSIKNLDNELELIIMDDGIGMPDELNWKNTGTLGLKLVLALVENQLDGSIDMENMNKTKFIIKFKIET